MQSIACGLMNTNVGLKVHYPLTTTFDKTQPGYNSNTKTRLFSSSTRHQRLVTIRSRRRLHLPNSTPSAASDHNLILCLLYSLHNVTSRAVSSLLYPHIALPHVHFMNVEFLFFCYSLRTIERGLQRFHCSHRLTHHALLLSHQPPLFGPMAYCTSGPIVFPAAPSSDDGGGLRTIATIAQTLRTEPPSLIYKAEPLPPRALQIHNHHNIHQLLRQRFAAFLQHRFLQRIFTAIYQSSLRQVRP